MITEILHRERRQKETQSQRCEEAVLPALKMEKATNQGMETASGSRKRQANRFSRSLLTLAFSPVRASSDFCSPQLKDNKFMLF